MEKQDIKIFESREELEDFVPVMSIRKLSLKEKDLCIAHNKDGFYVFDNKCPHYSVPLDTGNLNYFGEVVCSLHAYRYNLKDGWETTGKNLCLRRYPVKIEENGVFVTI